jgi:hypothetical protein
MKIAIVTSNDLIFRKIGSDLLFKINTYNSTDIFYERSSISIFKILKYRLQKFSFFVALDQILFKFFDVFFLRRKFYKKLKKREDLNFQSIENLNSDSAFDQLKKYDLVIGIATSILKRKIINAPKYGIINIHPGVLPNYRGIGNFWAVYKGDIELIGSTCHWMTEKIDYGKIICISKISLNEEVRSLWDINLKSYEKGIDDLSEIINTNRLFKTDVKYNIKDSKYFTWNGMTDYFKFLKQIKNEV